MKVQGKKVIGQMPHETGKDVKWALKLIMGKLFKKSDNPFVRNTLSFLNLKTSPLWSGGDRFRGNMLEISWKDSDGFSTEKTDVMTEAKNLASLKAEIKLKPGVTKEEVNKLFNLLGKDSVSSEELSAFAGEVIEIKIGGKIVGAPPQYGSGAGGYL